MPLAWQGWLLYTPKPVLQEETNERWSRYDQHARPPSLIVQPRGPPSQLYKRRLTRWCIRGPTSAQER